MTGLTRSQPSERCGIDPETSRRSGKIGFIPRPPRSLRLAGRTRTHEGGKTAVTVSSSEVVEGSR